MGDLVGLGPGPVCAASTTVLEIVLRWYRGCQGCQYFEFLPNTALKRRGNSPKCSAKRTKATHNSEKGAIEKEGGKP